MGVSTGKTQHWVYKSQQKWKVVNEYNYTTLRTFPRFYLASREISDFKKYINFINFYNFNQVGGGGKSFLIF